MAGLPQAILPGRGMIAMAGGTYGGQSALAIGVSQLSDTGKWAYKLQGTMTRAVSSARRSAQVFTGELR